MYLQRVQQSLFGLLSSGYSELPSCADGRGLEGSPFSEIREEFVQTTTGRILVAVEGDSKKPPIITYPDLGLDHLSNYRVKVQQRTFNLLHETQDG